MSILAQFLGFIVFFILIFFTVAPMFFFVIGAIQIRDDDDDDDDDDKIFINLLEIITAHSLSQPCYHTTLTEGHDRYCTLVYIHFIFTKHGPE